MSVNPQRGQFECFGFDSNLDNTINSLMVYIFMYYLVVQIVFHIFSYRREGLLTPLNEVV